MKKKPIRFNNFLNSLMGDNLVKMGLVLIGLIIIITASAPILSKYGPLEKSGPSLLEPNHQHPLGTDDVGHDIFSQMLYGARSSVKVGFIVGIGATLLALIVGGFAGYGGGVTEAIIMRVVDVFLCIPRFPVLIVFAHFFGASINNIIFFLVIFSWPSGARLVRSNILAVKNSPLVESEKLFGARGLYIFSRHILPELIPLLIAIFVLDASHAVLAEAGLSFLGLGDTSTVSWGIILHYAFIFPGLLLTKAWLWWVLPAASGISLFVLGLMLVSSGLEKHFNPKMKKQSKMERLFLKSCLK